MRQFDPGLGRKYSHNTKRVVNKDGSFNIVHKGIRKQAYQSLLGLSTRQFVVFIILTYLGINLVFSAIYLLIGVDSISFASESIHLSGFIKAFSFSMQTFTTVGFGSVFPNDPVANFVSGMEAMAGWMFFAIATGLVYGRFSRPSARILFSNNALVSPYQNGQALMFRIVNRRTNILMEMEAKVMLVIDEDEGEGVNRKYYNLKLETSSIHFFPLSWTIVHPIVEGSPMYNKELDELTRKKTEIVIMIKGYDDSFSKNVHLRFSYIMDEVVWNARFIKNYKSLNDGTIELDIDAVHNYEKL